MWRGLLLCLTAAMGGQLVAGIPAAVASKRQSGYCANSGAVFRGRHRSLGITDPATQFGTPQYRNCTFGRMAASGIGYFRGTIDWASVEPAPDDYVFTTYDDLVSDLAKHHMRFLPILVGPPRWASSAPKAGARQGVYPPLHPGQFAAFAAQLVKRYGPRGTFWQSHRSVPYYPIRAWQIWNEPNLEIAWEPAPDPAAYALLLRTAYFAIKAADRGATVVMAGMPFVGLVPSPTYVTQLYQSGVKGAFDAMAVHDYAPNAHIALARLRIIRGIMRRFRDSRPSLWVTEFAWSSDGPVSAYRRGWVGQSVELRTFFRLWSRNRRALRLGELMWFGWRDLDYAGLGLPDLWAWHTGLFTQALKPKPAYPTFVRGARRINR